MSLILSIRPYGQDRILVDMAIDVFIFLEVNLKA